jgi:GNAT superfamily N-acetyltransferase
MVGVCDRGLWRTQLANAHRRRLHSPTSYTSWAIANTFVRFLCWATANGTRGPESAGAKLSATEPFALALADRLFYERGMMRQAVASDAVKAVPLIMQAIGHIAFVLSGTSESQEAASILSDFFGQEDNRISCQNTLAMEEEGDLVGVAIFYDGAKAREPDAPLERAAAKKSGDSNYSIPTEPEASEFYLDTLSVSPRCQGKGYGRQLIEAGCDRARKLGHHRNRTPSRGGPCGGQTAVRACRVLHGLY